MTALFSEADSEARGPGPPPNTELHSMISGGTRGPGGCQVVTGRLGLTRVLTRTTFRRARSRSAPRPQLSQRQQSSIASHPGQHILHHWLTLPPGRVPAVWAGPGGGAPGSEVTLGTGATHKGTRIVVHGTRRWREVGTMRAAVARRRTGG
eukprot:747810-Hanusia_phi.AAC.2